MSGFTPRVIEIALREEQAGVHDRVNDLRPTVRAVSSQLDRRAFLAAVGSAAILGGCGELRQAVAAAPSFHNAADRAALGSGARRAPRPGPRTLEQAIRGRVFTRGGPGYTAAAAVFNTRFRDIRPAAVARPVDAIDVRDAVRFTVAHGLRTRARSGGHSYAGYSTLDGGVVIDLRDLRQITVDRAAGTATVGAGAQLIDVTAALAARGAVLPLGSCPSVGISGATLGGGFGLAARALGLTADSLIAARIVTADGALRTVDPRSDPELLWALRGGGGGNFGIVTDFTFRIHRLPRTLAYFDVAWPWSSAPEAIDAWQRWAPTTTDAISSILHLTSGDPPSVRTGGQYFGSSSALVARLAPLLAVPGAQLTAIGDMAGLALALQWAGCEGLSLAACHTAGTAPGGTLPRTPFSARSDYVDRPLGSDGLNALVSAVESAVGDGAILCDSYGGAINRVAPTASAFVHRDQLFCMQMYTQAASPAWIDQGWRAMRPYVSGQAYQNYIDPNLASWRRAYYGENYPRLQRIRREVDPHHYFDFRQAID